jgi:nucleotide-binding universal stress UspA family protein
MKTIIAALDFSDASKLVLAQTAELARATGSDVHLVHAIESLANFYDIYGYTVPDTSEFERHANERAALRLTEKAADLGISVGKVTTKVLAGPVVDALLEYTNDLEDSVLVIGTHGHGVLARVLMGSVAEKILRRSKIPVLMIPVRD